MTITRCSDLSAARWLEQRDEDWGRLAGRGPIAFDKYARLRLIPDPSYAGQTQNDVDRPEGLSDNEQFTVVLSELAHFTRTPDNWYLCIWEGWPYFAPDDPLPKIVIPNRAYFLFHGTADDFGDWESQIMSLLNETEAPTPAFVWPADFAWCVTCDIDPHFATIGAGPDAIDRIISDTRIDAVDDDPDTEPPYYY